MDLRVAQCFLLFTFTRLRMKAITISQLGHLPAQEMAVGDLTMALHAVTGGKEFTFSGTMHTEWMPMNLMAEPKGGGSRVSSLPIIARTDKMIGSHLAMAVASHLRSEILPLSAVRQLPSI
jgi:hypothetical protein